MILVQGLGLPGKVANSGDLNNRNVVWKYVLSQLFLGNTIVGNLVSIHSSTLELADSSFEV